MCQKWPSCVLVVVCRVAGWLLAIIAKNLGRGYRGGEPNQGQARKPMRETRFGKCTVRGTLSMLQDMWGRLLSGFSTSRFRLGFASLEVQLRTFLILAFLSGIPNSVSHLCLTLSRKSTFGCPAWVPLQGFSARFVARLPTKGASPTRTCQISFHRVPHELTMSVFLLEVLATCSGIAPPA